jgi:hypothetical protein
MNRRKALASISAFGSALLHDSSVSACCRRRRNCGVDQADNNYIIQRTTSGTQLPTTHDLVIANRSGRDWIHDSGEGPHDTYSTLKLTIFNGFWLPFPLKYQGKVLPNNQNIYIPFNYQPPQDPFYVTLVELMVGTNSTVLGNLIVGSPLPGNGYAAPGYYWNNIIITLAMTPGPGLQFLSGYVSGTQSLYAP